MPALRVLTYNVHGCVGVDGRHEPSRIADAIAREEPDVAVLQELDRARRRRTGHVDQPALLALRTGMTALFAEAWPGYGIALLARVPTRLVCRAPLPTVRGVPPVVERRMALWVEVDVAGTTVALFGTHLGLLPHERRLQIGALLGDAWMGAVPAGTPRVLLGDLNTHPRSPLFGRLLLAPCPGAAPLRDACAEAPSRPGATFPSLRPMLRLDHVLVGGGLCVTRASVPADALVRRASDHLPLVVDLGLAR